MTEYGPWIGWNGGTPPAADDVKVEVSTNIGLWCGPAKDISWSLTGSCPVYAYRVRIEPKATETICYIDKEGNWWHMDDFAGKDPRKAIVTVQGDDISIKWSDD